MSSMFSLVMGVASLFIFHINAPDFLKLTDDNHNIDLRQIARTIKKECSEKPPNRDRNKIRLYPADASQPSSNALLRLL